MLVQLALAVSCRLRWLLRLLGVEPDAFDDLLAARVTLDLRGAKLAGRGDVMVVLAMSLFVGFLIGIAAFHVDDPFHWALFELSVASALLGMVLLLHLGNILLDGTDLHVVGPLPVPERTLYAARIAHALLYVSVVALCLHVLPALFVGFAYAPWSALALLPAALLATVLVVAAVALFHAALLTVFGPERFKRVTLWTQVSLGALTMGGFQLGPRLIDFQGVAERVEQQPELMGLVPTAWFAGLFALLQGEATPGNAALAGLAVLAPALLLFIAVRLGARHFIAGLTFQGSGGEQRRPFAPSLFQRLGAHLARDRTERAGYDWALALSRREPAFLRTAYVQVAGLFVMGLSWTFLALDRHGPAPRHLSPFALYLFPLLVPTVLDVSCYSEQPQAAGMLRALPIDAPVRFHLGALKALFAGMLLPIFVLLFTAAALAGGAGGLPDLCLSSAAALWLGAGVARRMRLHLPFTRKMRYGSTSTVNLVVVFAVLGLTVLAGLGHALLRRVPYLPLAVAPVVAYLAWREYRGLKRGGRRVRFEDDPRLGEAG